PWPPMARFDSGKPRSPCLIVHAESDHGFRSGRRSFWPEIPLWSTKSAIGLASRLGAAGIVSTRGGFLGPDRRAWPGISFPLQGPDQAETLVHHHEKRNQEALGVLVAALPVSLGS